MLDFDLSGKTAIVIGGSRGIGKALALGLAGAGADVVVASRTLADLENTAGEIRRLGRRSLAVVTDVSRKSDIDNLVAISLAEFGRIDTLVYDPAFIDSCPILELKEGEWDRTMVVNLKGCFLACQAVGKSMIERGGGNIIIITSNLGIRLVSPERGAYSVSKAGLIMLTLVLAKEWGQYNIRVNAIAPGLTETEAVKARRSKPEDWEQYLQKAALGRVTQPEDIVGTAVLLASEASRCTTGQVITIDAGEML